jgi:hypothetical protein
MIKKIITKKILNLIEIYLYYFLFFKFQINLSIQKNKKIKKIVNFFFYFIQ